MKKFTAILCALVLVAMTAVTAFAAGINDSEQAVIDALGKEITMKNGSMVIPSDFVNQAENYFNTIEMTADESSKIIALLEETGKYMTSTGAENIGDMTTAQKKELLSYGQKIVGVLDMTMTYDQSSKILYIYAPDGKVAFQAVPTLTTKSSSSNGSSNNSNTSSTSATSSTNKSGSTTSSTAVKTTGATTDFSGFVAVGALALVIVAGAAAYVVKTKKEA
jgi:hypothetical protein